MMAGFEKVVERRIKKAQRQGAFDNLPGAGRPLELSDDSHIPEELRLSYKILKNADCLPPEVELRKEIKQTEDLLAGVSDIHEQYRLNKKLNFLITKVNMMRSTSVEMEIPQRYMGRLSERIGGKE
ncbi:MAG: DnaJ family domain-containing protein [Thermodesulfobacteriota bacterium]|nr:DnaJ family domain-containing protein [Thermodesulfobacteriota bacterium]